MSSDKTYSVVESVIKDRKTLKVLGDPDNPIEITAESAAKNDPAVIEALKTAGWSPFHYDRAEEGIAEPWRAYVLKHEQCREFATRLYEWFDDLAPGNKLPRMLAACGSMVVVTWLPEFRSSDTAKEKEVNIDDEHLAAASSMVQNFLLLLTAKGMGTYWSSGGKLNSPLVYEKLGISKSEKFLAAVFIEYPETLELDIERAPGKLRDKRSDSWVKEV